MSEQPINGHAPQPQAQQPQIPVECMPQPIPAVCFVQSDPVRGVLDLVVIDATGQRHIFLSPDYAVGLAADLNRAASAARTGLVIP